MSKKTALITGATRGIGKAIAEEFAKQGYNLVLNYRNKERALETKEELSKYGTEILCVKGDVSNFEDVEYIFEKAIEEFEKIDVLVNNAGITKDNLAVRMSPEEFEQVIDVNLKGVFYCMKLAAKHMMKNRQGSIISISSISGLKANVGQINYAASKSGVISMTKTLALELASRNIRCNCIAPGFIDTEMTQVLSDKIKDTMKDSIPLKRFGKAEDIAKVAYFLASEESSYMTGQVLSVDGGMSL